MRFTLPSWVLSKGELRVVLELDSMLWMIRRFAPAVLGVLLITLAVSALLQGVNTEGWLSGLALLAGAVAYAMMAVNLLLAARSPLIEKLFGPLDRVYEAHQAIGTAILAVIGLHLILTPVALAVDRGQSLLESPTPAVPLGILGFILLAGSIALSLNPRVPYDRWQRVHAATGAAFLILTAHGLVGLGDLFSLASPTGVLLVVFALIGIAGFVTRLVGKARGGTPFVVMKVEPLERAVELVLTPERTEAPAPHTAGQFAFLTAALAGEREETHPFTLTGAEGDREARFLIRETGDWTARAQAAFAPGDRVRIDGPFGEFTPAADPSRPEVWIAGGSGITPFLSALRSRRSAPPVGGRHAAVELVVAARGPSDAPCWDELLDHSETLPWLTLTPAFSDDGNRLDDATLEELIARTPDGADWYLCGPGGLLALAQAALEGHPSVAGTVYWERYEWRKSASAPAARDEQAPGPAVPATR